MKFLENDLENIIYNTDSFELEKRGLLIEGKRLRQLHIGNYGFSDIVTFKKPQYVPNENKHECYNVDFILPEITVYELKKDCINELAFFQAVRYVKGIQKYIEKYKHNSPLFNGEYYNFHIEALSYKVRYNIVLIGKEVDLRSDFTYLPSIFENVSFYTYDYDFDGIRFKQHDNFCLINEGF